MRRYKDWEVRSKTSLADSPKQMRQSSKEDRCKRDTHGHHGQHRGAGETVMLERRGCVYEQHAIDRERRGKDRAHGRRND